MSKMIRTLVVDDDLLSRNRLRDLLSREEDVELIGECADGSDAIPIIRDAKPDLVFLDVEMPRMGGFDVVDAIGADKMPAVVFATAHAEFALRAFDALALDYLLKPFDDERFQQTMERARRAAHTRNSERDPRLGALVEFLHAPQKPQYPELIAVKVGDVFRFLEVKDIDWIEADGNYVRVHIDKSQRLLHKTLTEMEERLLDPARFVRIHRSTIVNLSRIGAVEPLFHGALSVILKNGAKLECSRRYRPRLQERVYFMS
jgi:two-component system LytT family response regulator